ncbi:1-(5-phosphoribosyl)-5-((5-phosphoribosylamino)methylideneamino)imidazole-4-carboxamide isomerase [Sulfuracidifex tepidarius]|uniref:1-(5-phosphoribosyl)-5-[(5-phosphoribosylamino)methylideneamino] imidazole-4-carboxamide isomerase n=1 Tax=Sulfuracidifex tepidarius TaxID=1294262 RepID=A0A510DV18_9CREN|nr:1-(5-phosphoribosyl)-5-((5-phosphoribosylamino)methylideneamino)imidazole-4-carboxamide isomerase [Sulfuracidifex tepidarius]BBG24014.1 Imidazole glycerol phosphate synthase subunit HisF [Sulfuracidifex tepidarius]BBG26769.1 Imidazole glycerol phosphate synthase subunit HisF [Sulfuracidifex tepidarius]
MKVIPSIDISEGKAVKRIRGKSGSGIEVGDPFEVAEQIFSMGYDSVHVVDLDGAEGKGRNLSVIKRICEIGFSSIQVGGGIRDIESASSIIKAGASSIVMSTLPFQDENKFLEIKRNIGDEKILVSLDYNSEGNIMVRGWSTAVNVSLVEAIERSNRWNLRGVIFTYVENEGTKKGIDVNLGRYTHLVKGIKEYAGGISTMEDLKTLKGARIDYAIVGMAFYTNSLKGVIDV